MDLLLLGVWCLAGFIQFGLLQWGREASLGLHLAPSHFRSPARVAGEGSTSVLLSPLCTNLAGCRDQVLAAPLADEPVIWEGLERQIQGV